MTTAASPRLRLEPSVYVDADHAIAVCGNVVLSYSAKPPNPHYLKAWTLAMDELVVRLEAQVSVVTIIRSGTRTPDEPSRLAIRTTISRHMDDIGAFAFVVEGEGFMAAAMRSALSLMNLTARYKFPQKVFATMSEAAPWVLAQSRMSGAQGVDSELLVAAAAALHGQVH